MIVPPLQPQEQNLITEDDGPCRLIKNHYSVRMEWVKLVELTDDYAIFESWPTEQKRIPVTHLMDMPDLVWAKVEDGRYYMTRAQYDMGNEQL